MLINKNILISLSVGLLLGFITSYFVFKEEKDIIPVKVSIPLKISPVSNQFDTVKNPEEIKPTSKEKTKTIIDSAYYEKYIELKDSIAKDNAYKEAITIREYNNLFEDDNIKINSYSKVRGTLMESQVSYETKEKTIIVDTTLNIPIPRKAELFVGGELILPTDPLVFKEPSITLGGILVNKKHNKAYTVGYDFNNKAVKGGLFFKL